ncbi:uncharacterized protein GLRG_11743, partial [Colletotrichum graminicola M1.001]
MQDILHANFVVWISSRSHKAAATRLSGGGRVAYKTDGCVCDSEVAVLALCAGIVSDPSRSVRGQRAMSRRKGGGRVDEGSIGAAGSGTNDW